MFADESLTIETPEQIGLELPVAGLGSRFLALTVDTVLQLTAVIALFLVLAFGVPGVFGDGGVVGTLGPALAIFVAYAFYWGYFAVFEIAWNGRTPGKRVAGIRVVKDNGRPVRAYEAIARNILRAIDFLPAMYALGVVTMLLNRSSRRLGDFVAGTLVVHDKKIALVTSDWGTAEAGMSDHDAPAHLVARIGAQELTLIESYLRRRFDLDPLVRDHMAQQIVTRMSEKTGIAPPAGGSNDAFLEQLARLARDLGRFR